MHSREDIDVLFDMCLFLRKLDSRLFEIDLQTTIVGGDLLSKMNIFLTKYKTSPKL